jgi:hypothetical protein
MTEHNEPDHFPDAREMVDLAARIERAEGPDRALDAEIAAAVYGGEIVWKMTNYTMESYPARRYASAQHVGGYGNDHVPEYTASIDAAMQLVPDGMFARLFCEAGQAIIVKPFSGGWLEVSRSALCPGIAQALCAAAIRARSAS